MMVKVFTTNKDGKIEFTKEELETLLSEVWNDGYNRKGSYLWSWTSPTITTPYYSTGTLMNRDAIDCDANMRGEHD